ncbi:MAG TPA: SDR family oxidoreductase [Candidatus Methylomirabilis sp.]
MSVAAVKPAGRGRRDNGGSTVTNTGYDFTGKTALLTGGSKGIGRGCVEAFGRGGAKVAFTYRHEDGSVRDLWAWGQAHGVSLFGVQADAVDPASYDPLCRAVSAFTGEVLHILVNNIGDPIRRSAFAASDDVLWVDCLTLNLLSATRATRTFLPLLQRSDGAVIVNVSSIAGSTTGAGDSLHYGVSKAALDTFTAGLARELKTVRVVGVAPSAIDTDFHLRHSTPARLQKVLDQVPLGRIGTVQEVST